MGGDINNERLTSPNFVGGCSNRLLIALVMAARKGGRIMRLTVRRVKRSTRLISERSVKRWWPG
jgi:hypothetical protein